MRTEKGFAIAFMVGVLFKIMHWPGGGVLLVLTLSTLSILYFAGAFYFFCDKKIENQNLALSIISGLFLSIVPLGVLFKIQYYPGAQMMLLFGTISVPLILIVTYFLKTKAADNLKTYYKNMLLRTGILTILTALLCLTSTATLLKIQYWDDPELARVKTLHYTNPDNEEYKQQHDEYLLKRDSLYLQEIIHEEN